MSATPSSPSIAVPGSGVAATSVHVAVQRVAVDDSICEAPKRYWLYIRPPKEVYPEKAGVSDLEAALAAIDGPETLSCIFNWHFYAFLRWYLDRFFPGVPAKKLDDQNDSFKGLVEVETYVGAIRAYVSSPSRNLPLLFAYARKMGIEKKVHEVMLFVV